MRRSSVTKYRSDRLSHIMSTETKKAKQRSNRTNVKSNQENISNYLLFYTFTLHEPAPPHCVLQMIDKYIQLTIYSLDIYIYHLVSYLDI